MPTEVMKSATSDPARVRSITIRSGSSGWSLRLCHQTNATRIATPRTMEPHVTALPQLDVHAWLNPYTTKKSPALASTVPDVEPRPILASSARHKDRHADDANAAKKRLTKRHQRHDAHWVSAPPRRRPIAAPEPPMIAVDGEGLRALLGLRERH